MLHLVAHVSHLLRSVCRARCSWLLLDHCGLLDLLVRNVLLLEEPCCQASQTRIALALLIGLDDPLGILLLVDLNLEVSASSMHSESHWILG